jgi:hypothetical protein
LGEHGISMCFRCWTLRQHPSASCELHGGYISTVEGYPTRIERAHGQIALRELATEPLLDAVKAQERVRLCDRGP